MYLKNATLKEKDLSNETSNLKGGIKQKFEICLKYFLFYNKAIFSL